MTDYGAPTAAVAAAASTKGQRRDSFVGCLVLVCGPAGGLPSGLIEWVAGLEGLTWTRGGLAELLEGGLRPPPPPPPQRQPLNYHPFRPRGPRRWLLVLVGARAGRLAG